MSETADPPEIDVDTDPDLDQDDEHDDTDHDSQQEAPADEEIEEIEPTSEELDGDDGGLFSVVEDAESSTDSGDDASDDPSDTDTGYDDSAESDGAAGASPRLEQSINHGAARLAVVGLDEDDHDVDELEAEFREVFATFRLGYFGAETIDEYIMIDDDEDVNPMWGLAATIAACVAFTLWVRPDGDQQIKRARDAINSIANGQGVAA
jgi:hypothetical protein